MLSVVSIFKNERANIAGFISSWSDVADEIIVLDTGSTDGTFEELCKISQDHTKLRVFRSEWKQDFSAARNEAASHALGIWILWADADDRVHIPSVPRIRELVRTRDAAYAFQVASDVGNGNWHRFMQVRMYPNLPSVKFSGKIHETLEPALRANGIEILRDENTIIAHLGYADENLRKSKAIRNLDLLLHDGEPTTPDQMAQVGDALYVLGKFRVGIGYYEEAVRLSKDPKVAKIALAEKLIVGYLHWHSMEKALEVIQTCLERYSVAYEFWMGEYYRMLGGFRGTAKMHYERCLDSKRDLGHRECNGDVMISEAKMRIKELEGECVPA